VPRSGEPFLPIHKSSMRPSLLWRDPETVGARIHVHPAKGNLTDSVAFFQLRRQETDRRYARGLHDVNHFSHNLKLSGVVSTN